MAQTLVAVFDESGVLVNRGNKVMIGDLDPIAEVVQRWGGSRQRGRIRIELYIQPNESLDTSADFGGASGLTAPKPA